ncbi:hypothetical protein DL96DRAFT_1560716 [Flagelloscypha sp. PMI_526]|nr:hypothetical protein DL96DRAFT_1560716 [Flagelloscypha sp. PMI_526]
MASSSPDHFQARGLGTTQATIYSQPDRKTSSTVLATVRKSIIYAVGGTAGVIVVAICVLSLETVLWTVGLLTGTLEDYHKEKWRRWAFPRRRCGTGRMNSRRLELQTTKRPEELAGPELSTDDEASGSSNSVKEVSAEFSVSSKLRKPVKWALIKDPQP